MTRPAPPPSDSSSLAQRLLSWYDRHRRDLPWRHTRDPYRILVSEVMAQQTQIDRVVTYYHRWLDNFPTAADLAQAQREEVQRCWQGLGYPSRADRLQAACHQVVHERQGVWPTTVSEWQSLPGIGPYTAAAVACFAQATAVAVVDTNVARVYARRDALAIPIDRQALQRHADDALAVEDPINYNNALMELGALVCTARKPDCPACPWSANCQSRQHEDYLIATSNPLKVATKKKQYGTKITGRDHRRVPIVLALIHDEQGNYCVTRRPAGVPEAGKWELPGGKREPGESDREALAREIQEELGVEMLSARPFLRWDHLLTDVATETKQQSTLLQFHCYRCRLFAPQEAKALASDVLRWVTPEQWLALTFPQANAPLQAKFADYHKL